MNVDALIDAQEGDGFEILRYPRVNFFVPHIVDRSVLFRLFLLWNQYSSTRAKDRRAFF